MTRNAILAGLVLLGGAACTDRGGSGGRNASTRSDDGSSADYWTARILSDAGNSETLLAPDSGLDASRNEASSTSIETASRAFPPHIDAGGASSSLENNENDTSVAAPGSGNENSSAAARDAGSTEEPPCVHTFTSGHGDVYLDYSNETFALRVRAALTDAATEHLYSPDTVCIIVPESTYADASGFGGRPAGDSWTFIGVEAGTPFWFLPQTARNDAPWLGLASGAWPSKFGARAQLSFRSLWAPPGAHFSAWLSDAFGAPQVLLSSSAGDWTLDVAPSTHAHLNWAFTTAGTYTFEVSAHFVTEPQSGRGEEPVASAIYRFEVRP